MAQEPGVKPSELDELKKKTEEYLNGWKRERADFINYKKDEMERIGQLIKYANEEIILKILPVLDNLCLAVEHPVVNTGQAFLDGVVQIKKQIEDFLKKEGVEPIKSVGEKFDPNIMEAVGEAPADAEGSGVVKEEVQRGYTLHGRVIRVAKVKVAK